MTSLRSDLRRQLEKAICAARKVAEAGARAGLEAIAVHYHEPYSPMNPAQRELRNKLRAHGRQLGDEHDKKKGAQAIDRLASECAYEHWHRMLFARFLAENELLVQPETGMAVTLEECAELARERKIDRWVLASEYAQTMLPKIFRPDDSVLAVPLPREARAQLETLLESLPSEIFRADDSLGWVYQYWRAEEKDEVNESGEKIGAKALPAVTQLFTEDYMVHFLLHNTLGAWWVVKRKAEGKEVDASRFPYLRLKEDGSPAAGAFSGWPKSAKELKVLDPCMGSGHFLVFALPILVGFRMEEEKLSKAEAVHAVLRDNLYGLELDARCTQIAAFHLALAAWRMAGHQPLPPLHLACSGLGIHAEEGDWIKLAGGNPKLRDGMRSLYQMFKDAPTLGSLINPHLVGRDLLEANFQDLHPLLKKAIEGESADEVKHELAIAALGIAEATEILSGKFSLVATNVPYLGRGKQDEILKEYCETVHPEAKADLATCFVERCLAFCAQGGSTALVTPQNWLFLGTYKKLRKRLLETKEWNVVARLGPRAFETISGEVVNVALLALTAQKPEVSHAFAGMDASQPANPDTKALALREGVVTSVNQKSQLENPDARVSLANTDKLPLLGEYSDCFQGVSPADFSHYGRMFWEIALEPPWRLWQSTVEKTMHYGGRIRALLWDEEFLQAVDKGTAYVRGQASWGKLGVAVSAMGELPCTLFLGEPSDTNTAVIVPKDPKYLTPIWCFCASSQYREKIRSIDQALKVTNATLTKISFDLAHWQRIAAERYPDGLPKPHSNDPTQWLFSGHPNGSEQPLQVAAARLLGYRWPRQTGSSFPDCPALGPDGLKDHADLEGIVCLSPLRGRSSAADRLRALLSDAFGAEWSGARERELIAATGSKADSLEEWLRDEFFAQHCAVFHHRPFVWHIWDGRKDGFHALVNYHRLAGPDGEGRRTLESLIYSYLGDWITRQRDGIAREEPGAEARLAAAQELRTELEKILAGEPPYDLFVRWKPLQRQAIGWEPDLNDGVRLNIRPFLSARLSAGRTGAGVLRSKPNIKWDKDRGKEPFRSKEEFPWFWGWNGWNGENADFLGGREFKGERYNDLHYSITFKRAARERKEGVRT